MNGENEQKVYTFLKVSEQPLQAWLCPVLLARDGAVATWLQPSQTRPMLPCPALGEFFGI